MGQNESNPIRNMDKRTARREYREDFSRAISSFRSRQDNTVTDGSGLDWDNGSIRVCVRKRPIFQDEIDNFEFDVATCVGGEKIIIHDARMHIDMRKQFINHHEFQFDRVFNECVGNDEVYQKTAAPLTQIAIDGGYATCLMYGQTGSGNSIPPLLTTTLNLSRENLHNVLNI
jgi:hypothetical protein